MSGPADFVGALFVREGQILLGRRNAEKVDAAGCWDLIGGRVEPGETFEAACVREVAEEVGVQAEIDAEIFRARVKSGAEYRIFRVSRWSGEVRLANDEHSELGWFSPEAACGLEPLAAIEYVELFRGLSGERRG